MNEGQQAHDARPSGPSIRQQVFGAPTGKPTAPGGGDPFLRPFFETAIEHVWGGVWNRPGLELKYRSLVVVSVRAATGHHEELKTHLRGALNLGWTVDELREAVLQTAPYDVTWDGERGRVDDLLRKYVDEWRLTGEDTLAYLCGHPEMIEHIKSILRRKGFPNEAIREEIYWIAPTRPAVGESRSPTQPARDFSMAHDALDVRRDAVARRNE